MSPLLLTLLPIAVILSAADVFRKAADISGIVGWLAICAGGLLLLPDLGRGASCAPPRPGSSARSPSR